MGAEINRSLLSACRRLSVDDRIAFIYSDPDEIRRHAPFDAVFCMAVLQRTPHCVADLGLDSLKDLYPFEKFDRQISELDRLLEPGGLLIVHHTQYLVGDATVADNYEPLASFPPTRTPELKFDKSSRESRAHPSAARSSSSAELAAHRCDQDQRPSGSAPAGIEIAQRQVTDPAGGLGLIQSASFCCAGSIAFAPSGTSLAWLRLG